MAKLIRFIEGKEIQQSIGFTWSPNEREFSQDHIKGVIDTICRYCSFYWYQPEYRDRELQKGLHYHGVFHIYDLYKWFRVHKQFKFFTMEPHWEFNPGSAWYSYCEKDFKLNLTTYCNYGKCMFHNIQHCTDNVSNLPNAVEKKKNKAIAV